MVEIIKERIYLLLLNNLEFSFNQVLLSKPSVATLQIIALLTIFK